MPHNESTGPIRQGDLVRRRNPQGRDPKEVGYVIGVGYAVGVSGNMVKVEWSSPGSCTGWNFQEIVNLELISDTLDQQPQVEQPQEDLSSEWTEDQQAEIKAAINQVWVTMPLQELSMRLGICPQCGWADIEASASSCGTRVQLFLECPRCGYEVNITKGG
jgi:predicted RNA-binding Zn-ribbon protein involved in translation (DUF1610 family)